MAVEQAAAPPATSQDGTTRRRAVEAARQALSRLGSAEALFLLAITILALSIRLYRLSDLPAEMWGDVITHYQLAQKVMSGHPYFDYEFGGDGPMLSYLNAAVASVLGLSFYTLKLTTVLAGTAVVVLTYFLGRDLFENRAVGLLAAYTAATSFWAITFSRQAKPYILAAVFAVAAVVLVLQKRRIAAGIPLGLGMYTQAAFWGTPIAFLASPITLLVGALWATPVLVSFAENPSQLVGSSSYIGEKMHAHLPAWEVALRVLDNIRKNALAFNVRGDLVFRHNIPLHPDLDEISGAFFLLGMALILIRIVRNRDRRLLLWFLVPFLVIQIPSVMDLHPLNVPAMGRTVGVMPFACVAIAYALYRLWQRLVELARPRLRHAEALASAVVGLFMIAILAINAYNYFVVYPRTLPNGNTPFGKIIAQQIDAGPPSTYSIVYGCCWGEWGQPEPDAVVYTLQKPRDVFTAVAVADLRQTVRDEIPKGARVVIYSSPLERGTSVLGIGSLKPTHSYMLRRNGWDVAWVISATKAG